MTPPYELTEYETPPYAVIRRGFSYLWKNAAAMAPGPAWVPTTLPMLV